MTDDKRGSCGCGSVRFTVTGKIRNVANCHCSKCRKFNGAAFSSYGVVAAADLRFEEGETELTAFRFPAGALRHFCRVCGTPIFNSNPLYPGFYMVHLGAFDQPQELLPRMNIFCDSQLAWLPELAALPSYPEAYQR